MVNHILFSDDEAMRGDNMEIASVLFNLISSEFIVLLILILVEVL